MKIIKLIRFVTPPEKWNFPVIIITGILVGLVIYLFILSKAPSYLSDNPETCMNCHIMAPQYATWMHSSHRENATCNDCHVPHNNVINKYYFKAKDGMRHATIFTLRKEPQVIFIHEEGQEVVQHNCIRCHENVIFDERTMTKTLAFTHYREDRKCWECHREIPHGRVNSLSSVPNARVPVPSSVIPEWIKKNTKRKHNETR